MSSLVTAEALGILTYDEIAPLDWFQWRCLLWDYLPGHSSHRSWAQIADSINCRCGASTPISGGDLLRAFQALCRYYPECATSGDGGAGMRVWTQILYGQVRKLLGGAMPPFLNLGYAGGKAVTLDAEDEPFRLPIQLYEVVLRDLPLDGQDVLEIGCGTGGGCAYVNKSRGPATLSGLDLLAENINECRRRCSPQIEFAICDAEALDIPSSSCDAVISIESSGHYPSMERFAREVRRVLRPGGWLLLADVRPVSAEWGEGRGLPDLLRSVDGAGLRLVHADNISEGVLRSIEAQEAGRQQFLQAVAAGGNVLSHLKEILLTCDSTNFRMLRDGSLQYWSIACQA